MSTTKPLEPFMIPDGARNARSRRQKSTIAPVIGEDTSKERDLVRYQEMHGDGRQAPVSRVVTMRRPPIADESWREQYCQLTFEEIVDHAGLMRAVRARACALGEGILGVMYTDSVTAFLKSLEVRLLEHLARNTPGASFPGLEGQGHHIVICNHLDFVLPTEDGLDFLRSLYDELGNKRKELQERRQLDDERRTKGEAARRDGWERRRSLAENAIKMGVIVERRGKRFYYADRYLEQGRYQAAFAMGDDPNLERRIADDVSRKA